MAVITYTRGAKCKDCSFHVSYHKGKLKRHYCANRLSDRFSQDTGLNDFVCNEWKLY